MYAPVAPGPYLALDAVFAGLLAEERRRMAVSLVAGLATSRQPPAPPPFQAPEIALIAALGFFVTSLVLSVAFT